MGIEQIEDIRERMQLQGEESHKQFEAVSHAVHAFADIMNEPGSSPAANAASVVGGLPRTSSFAPEPLTASGL